MERRRIDRPARKGWEPGCVERNRWCCPHCNTNGPVGMRKGSRLVRGVAAEGWLAVRVGSGQGSDALNSARKARLSSLLDERHATCCIVVSKRDCGNRGSTLR